MPIKFIASVPTRIQSLRKTKTAEPAPSELERLRLAMLDVLGRDGADASPYIKDQILHCPTG